MSEYTRHALSAAFPDLPEAEFKELCDDIRAEGLENPIILFEGKILDGWHRYRACEQTGVTPEFMDLPFGKDPQRFVVSENIKRRHLTPSERAAAIIKVFDEVAWRPPGGGNSGVSAQEMADIAGVSKRTIEAAKKAERKGLGDEVRKGKVSAHKAAGKDLPKKPSRIQQLLEEIEILTMQWKDAEERADALQAEAEKFEALANKEEGSYKTDRVFIEGLQREIKTLKAQVHDKDQQNNAHVREVMALRRKVKRHELALKKYVGRMQVAEEKVASYEAT